MTSSKEKSEGSIKIESQYERSSLENNSPFSFQFLFTNALLLSTGYFTLATELRLQAAKEEIVEGERFQNKLYKESEVYHLISIIIISVYVPIQILYLKQLVTSYENYYVKQISPIDEMQSNEYGNGPNSTILTNKQFLVPTLTSNFDKMGIFPYNENKKEE